MTSLPILLPEGFVTSVNVGDQITIGQIIASNKGPTDEIINIPQALKVNRKQAKKAIRKIPGEFVNIGDIIASKKSLFGTKTLLLRSKVAGTVIRFERDSGNLVIKTSSLSSTKDIISPVDGIIQICDNREIIIDTNSDVVIGERAQGGKVTGEIYVLQADDPYHLDADAIGKIAVSKNITREMISKGIGIGTAGIIGVGIHDEDIDYLIEKNFQIPIVKIKDQDFEAIKNWSGKKVFMNPETKSIIFLHL